ncbi:MAG: carbon starvation CstA family protein, partial [Tepidisphaeraceae bacterium]
MHAMPLLIGILCVFAIAYRYYSAFLAARVAVLDDARTTPAVRLNDGQNYHPTSKWVLFGHHFAAISGAGPLIGPVLAAQFGYLPGLLWIVIGVTLAGAVQDFLALACSIRRDGRSLAQIAFIDVGKTAGTAATVAIILILVVALAGLGKVVVKALGGETVKFAPGAVLRLPPGGTAKILPGDRLMQVNPGTPPTRSAEGNYLIPAGATIVTGGGGQGIVLSEMNPSVLSQGFVDSAKVQTLNAPLIIHTSAPLQWQPMASFGPGQETETRPAWNQVLLPADAVQQVPGSTWGVFTIAATIPIALFVGLWMYKIRPGHTIEASLIGGALTLGATVLGATVKDSSFAHWFNLSQLQITWAMAIYGFVAAVLPVWVLLAPRDYLSSFLKIGTIALLVFGVIIANPKLEAPAVNHVFLHGGPVLGPTASIFPFLFTTIMCGAISGFHALVSSGTTSKMLSRER